MLTFIISVATGVLILLLITGGWTVFCAFSKALHEEEDTD